MEFEILLRMAKENEPYAFHKLVELYQPLMVQASIVNGVFDEDLYHELIILLASYIQGFHMQ